MRVFEIEAAGQVPAEVAVPHGGCDGVECGCGLLFAGLTTGRLSPTATVVEFELSTDAFDGLVRAWLVADLGRSVAGAVYLPAELERDAADFAGYAAAEAAGAPLGAVVVRCWAPEPPDTEVRVRGV